MAGGTGVGGQRTVESEKSLKVSRKCESYLFIIPTLLNPSLRLNPKYSWYSRQILREGLFLQYAFLSLLPANNFLDLNPLQIILFKEF